MGEGGEPDSHDPPSLQYGATYYGISSGDMPRAPKSPFWRVFKN